MTIKLRVILLFVIIFGLLMTITHITIYQIGKISSAIKKELPKRIEELRRETDIDGLADQIRYDDEVITQSVRNYAFTKNPFWKQRYYEFVPDLDNSLNQIKALAEDSARPFFETVDSVNRVLLLLERDAIRLIESDRSHEAVSLLDGRRYAEAKQAYTNGVRDYFTHRGKTPENTLVSSSVAVKNAARLAQQVLDQYYRISGFFIFILVAGLIITYVLLNKSILHPLERLSLRIRKMAAGELHQTLPVSNDEIGTVARSFNDMSKNLVVAYAHLKNKADELENLNETLKKEIGERRKAEESIRESKQELELLNRKLSENQAQLLHSEKLASIGQLAAGVAHEINNPIGFVTSNSETLRQYFLVLREAMLRYGAGCETEEFRKFARERKLDFVLKDVDLLLTENQEGLARVAEIVKNLKSFAHIDVEAKQSFVNLNDGLKSSMLMARNEIKYKAEVETDFGELPLFYCNIGEINQVFLNILVNAAQAIAGQSRSEKGIIRVRTFMESEWICFEIADNGPGIPSEVQARIFDPFFTTKEVGKGTGLGLSISHSIIAKYGGDIQVKSEVGHGTAFTIKLPKSQEVVHGG